MSSGLHAYFQLVVKRIIPCNLAHKPSSRTKYILDLDFIKIRLFDKVAPKTCHNFTELCTHNQGFGYAGSSIDHVVRGFGLYGGNYMRDTNFIVLDIFHYSLSCYLDNMYLQRTHYCDDIVVTHALRRSSQLLYIFFR